jgi:hypothetical protein
MKTPMKLKLFGHFKDASNALNAPMSKKISGVIPPDPRKRGERRGG